MIVFLIQTLLLVAAGFALFRLWRAALPDRRWLRVLVNASFLARAFAGQVLFWISWAHLPVARSLQIGDGLWFFGLDAVSYFDWADGAAAGGWRAIASLDPRTASVTYVRALAVFVKLFGSVTSVALLMNLFCYLGMIAILVHWAAEEPRANAPVAFAILAISCAPGTVLWSLQPLKDSFFMFLAVAFVGGCAAWQRMWRDGESPWKRAATALLLALLLYAISGIRWYFGFAVMIAATIFVVLTVLHSRPHRVIATLAAIAVAFVLSRAVVFGAGSYLPDFITKVLTPGTAVATMRQMPTELLGGVEGARTSFVASGGRTSIEPAAGSEHGVVTETEPADEPVAPAAQPPAPARTPVPAPAVAPAATPPPFLTDKARGRIDRTIAAQFRAWNQGDAAGFVNTFWPSPGDPTFSYDGKVLRGPVAIAAFARTEFARADRDRDVTAGDWRLLAANMYTGSATLEGTCRSKGTDGVVHARDLTISVTRHDKTWKAVSVVAGPPHAIAAAPAAETEARETTVPMSANEVRAVRLLSGAAAVVVPQSIATRLGLFRVGGGRGLLWFTDIDTLVFDFVLFGAIVALWKRSRSALRNPMAWLVVLLTLLVGVPLVYAVTNFGTLFRLREMIYLGLMLVPLAIATQFKPEEPRLA